MGTQPHLQPSNPHFPHLKTGIKIALLVFSLFELFMILGCSLLLCRVLSSAPLQTLSGPAIHHSNPRSDEVLNELQLMRNGCHSVWDWIRSSAASTDNGNFFFKLRKKKRKKTRRRKKAMPTTQILQSSKSGRLMHMEREKHNRRLCSYRLTLTS